MPAAQHHPHPYACITHTIATSSWHSEDRQVFRQLLNAAHREGRLGHAIGGKRADDEELTCRCGQPASTHFHTFEEAREPAPKGGFGTRPGLWVRQRYMFWCAECFRAMRPGEYEEAVEHKRIEEEAKKAARG